MLPLTIEYMQRLSRATACGWNRFWFAPQDPATLGLIRILAGAMLLYTHLAWTLRLDEFFGADAWVSPEAAASALGDGEGRNFAWSYWWLIESPGVARVVHGLALVAFLCLTLGFASRLTAVLSFIAAVSYVNRVPGALFGLDQIDCMLAMYLMLGPSGGAYSVDRWLARRKARANATAEQPAQPTVSANIAIRLIQLHMCVIYFFAGLSKLQGEMWWSGAALWGAVANLEYQSLDATFLVRYPVLVALLTQITVYWELMFCAIVWPRLTRPVVLALAVPLHMGIAICMGMITFGLVMLVGCLSFVPPWLVRYAIERRPPGGPAAERWQATARPHEKAPRGGASGKQRRSTFSRLTG